MTKNTTDLREQLRVIIEDTDYRDYGEPDCEEQIRLLEQLISNREKLARLERGIYELERLHHIPQMFGDWESVIDDRIATLRKELESERKRINGTPN